MCVPQAAAETAYDMVSPVPDERDMKRVKRHISYGLAHQPVDLREGVAKAYSVVKEVNCLYELTFLKTRTSCLHFCGRFPLAGYHRYSTDHL